MKTDRDRIERLEERVRNMMAAMRELQRQIRTDLIAFGAIKGSA